MRLCIAIVLLCVSARADDGFKWVVTDQPGFQWSITEKGGDPESTVVSQPSSAGSGVLGPDKETTAPEPVSSRRYTRVELAKQAVDYANRQRFLQATVNPPNQVWNHLKNDHGFTAEQVDGLTFNQALWVHSGAHTGVITAWTGKPAQMAVKIKPSGHWERRCVNGLCRDYWIAD